MKPLIRLLVLIGLFTRYCQMLPAGADLAQLYDSDKINDEHPGGGDDDDAENTEPPPAPTTLSSLLFKEHQCDTLQWTRGKAASAPGEIAKYAECYSRPLGQPERQEQQKSEQQDRNEELDTKVQNSKVDQEDPNHRQSIARFNQEIELFNVVLNQVLNEWYPSTTTMPTTKLRRKCPPGKPCKFIKRVKSTRQPTSTASPATTPIIDSDDLMLGIDDPMFGGSESQQQISSSNNNNNNNNRRIPFRLSHTVGAV